MERVQRERDKAILDRDQVALERDQAKLDREQATLERDEAILDRDLLMAERVQDQRLQESIANCDQIKSELERLQRRKQAVASGKEKKRTTAEPVVANGGRRSPSSGWSFQIGPCGPTAYERGPGSMDDSSASSLPAQSRGKHS